MIKFKRGTICFTRGDGYWSKVERAVELSAMVLDHDNEAAEFGELLVYFEPDSWDVSTDGLIYTDNNFEAEFKQVLAQQYGFSDSGLRALCYSEQGMQGFGYVSFEVGTNFITEFNALTAMA
jgi:hypothetical protein